MKGICQLSSVPVRKDPDGKSEMTSMLLFGESFTVLTTNDHGWTKILTDFEQYEGWINSRQYHILHEPATENTVVNVFPFLQCDSPLGKIPVLPGSVLPDLKNGKYLIDGKAYKAGKLDTACSTHDIEKVAKKFLNAPYLWGGRSLFGLDCSGFTQVVFRICGKRLLRDAKQQSELGTLVDFRNQAQCGDLAFFSDDPHKITHVGIMLSPDSIIHASGHVRIDRMDDFGIMNSEDKQYTHKLRFIRRMFNS